MASVFKSAIQSNIGTSSYSLYTVPALTQTTVIGLSLANVSSSSITASAAITRSGATTYLIKNGPIPIGGSLIVVGLDQRLVLQVGDILSFISDTASSLDVVCSFLELT
jgi:hypothetical protein